MSRVLNKVVLITGAGTGIGRAAALLYAREGASVILVGRRQHLLGEVSEEIRSQGGSALPIEGDITCLESIEGFIRIALQRFNRIHILINNAGQAHASLPVHQLADEVWEEAIRTNLTGTFRVTRSLLPHFLEKRNGTIVNVASIAGMLGTRNMAAYSVAKSGIIALTKCVAAEYGPVGIRCNCVCPGIVLTPATSSFLESSAREPAEANGPLSRFAHPFEVAQGILYLGSEESSFVTGSVLTIDGGRTAC